MTDRSLLWVENCYPFNTRSVRILETLIGAGWRVEACAWDRSVDDHPVSQRFPVHVYRTPIGYQKPWKKAIRIRGYRSFVREVAKKVAPTLIGCSFWDMATLCATLDVKLPIWYDILDLPEGGVISESIASLLERRALRGIAGVSFASPFFSPLYQVYRGRKLCLQNLPAFDMPELSHQESLKEIPTVGFVGNVRYGPSLVRALHVFSELSIPFEIYGDGPALKEVGAAVPPSSLVRYHGRYEYADLPTVLGQLDLLWASYPSNAKNVRYAVSNKFYESIFFGVPAVFSTGTKLADFVKQHGIGFTVDDTSIRSLRESVSAVLNDGTLVSSVRRNLLAYREENREHLSWHSQSTSLLAWVDDLVINS